MRASIVLALLIASAPAGAAELYRWQDENGVVNYSNTPPPKTRAGKPATVVEDRLSVYTPERSVTDAIERRRLQLPPQPSASFTRPPEPERRVIAPPPPPPVAYDPCANLNDLNCPGYLYDGSPVFHGRRRPVPLVQPQLPPGTIAGQATGPNASIPGLSGNAPPPPPQTRSSGSGFTVRETERERDFPRR